MPFLVTITGMDGEHKIEWSKEIERDKAMHVMARLEGFYAKNRESQKVLAPRPSKRTPHPLQAALLRLAKKEDISDYSLRKIGEKLGGVYAQQVVHHMNQLVKKGLMDTNRKPL